jgi:ParB-like chromosome segregation protein Spo0J
MRCNDIMTKSDIIQEAYNLFKELSVLKQEDKIDAINKIRLALHEHSPFKAEPIDCVQWVSTDTVIANDYNPNSVAPPEMKLLELSISEDGYTQPVVTFQQETHKEVVDGFHRTRVAKESKDVRKRLYGYIPTVIINQGRTDLTDRMAATIRHNRARGKHNVDSMSDIVVELKKRNRSEDWIAKHLGMDSDEVLRLCQISGLTEMFSNSSFSKAWDIEVYEDGQDSIEELE